MTEEIIVNGVNVAGCEFLRNCIIPDNYGCKIDDSLCCDVGNCYYKQLKRLEQENFALTQENQQKSQTICDLYQENKELKEEIRFHNKENSNLLAERNAAQIGYDEIREVREHYRSALEEIKEINNKWLKRWMNDSDEVAGFEEIENKINEVLK